MIKKIYKYFNFLNNTVHYTLKLHNNNITLKKI